MAEIFWAAPQWCLPVTFIFIAVFSFVVGYRVSTTYGVAVEENLSGYDPDEKMEILQEVIKKITDGEILYYFDSEDFEPEFQIETSDREVITVKIEE